MKAHSHSVISFRSGTSIGALFLIMTGLCLTGCPVIRIADYGEVTGGLTGVYCSGTNEYMVVWYRADDLYQGGIDGATLSPAGEILMPPRRIVDSKVMTDGFTNVAPMRLAYNETQGHRLLAWTTFEAIPWEDQTVTTAVVYQDGTAEEPVPVTPGMLVDMVYNSQEDEYLAAVDPAGEGPVFGYRLSAQGAPLAEPFPLTRGVGPDGLACLVFSPEAGQYLAVNVAGDDSQPTDPTREVYVRLFEADGSPQGDWVTVFLFSGIVLWDWELEDDIVADYLPQGGNYAIFVHLTHQLGERCFQQTCGQRISQSAELIGEAFVANTDLSGLVSYASPRPALSLSPFTNRASLMYCFMHGVFSGQPLTATGIPQGDPHPLGLTYIVDGEIDTWPVTDPILVVPSSAEPSGLVLWTRFLQVFWDKAAFGMMIDLR